MTSARRTFDRSSVLATLFTAAMMAAPAAATSLKFQDARPTLGFKPGWIVVAGDIDGDGAPDLVVGHPTGGIAVIKNNGNGTFAAPWVSQSLKWAGGKVGVGLFAAGDTNADGRADVAVILNGQVQVLLGQANGTLSRPKAFSIASSTQSPVAGEIRVADLNGDRNGDLVIAITQRQDPSVSWLLEGTTVSVLLSDGRGGFGAAREFPANTAPRAMEIADFNGDGRRDVIVTNDTRTSAPKTVSVLFGNGDGTLGAPLATTLHDFNQDFGASHMVTSDLNGDSRQDIIVVRSAGFSTMARAEALYGNGDGTFSRIPRFWAADPGSGGRQHAAADLNRDGRGDLAAYALLFSIQRSAPYQILDDFYNSSAPNGHMLGNGLFGLVESYLPADIWTQRGAIVAADFDRDGWSDIAAIAEKVSQELTLLVLLNRTASLPPVALTSVTLSRNPMAGGNKNAGTVTLSAPAPAGGTVVEVLSTETCVFEIGGVVGCANTPHRVTVPAGETTAHFLFKAAALSQYPRTGTIIAQYRDVTKTAPNTLVATESTTNRPPTATFTYTCTGLTCQFDGSGSSDPDGIIVSYNWSFGCCGVAGKATGPRATFTYPQSGQFIVGLDVTDDWGAVGSHGEFVTVSQ